MQLSDTRTVAVRCAGLLVLILAGSRVAALDETAVIRERARQVLSQQRFQQVLPRRDDQGPPVRRRDRSTDSHRDPSTDGQPRSRSQQPLSAPARAEAPLHAIGTTMAYVFLIVVALIVVAGIVYAVVNWTSQERVEAASPRWQVGPVEGRVEPEQRHDSRPGFCRRADSLAAAGQYEEAAHVLLLGTIDQLVQVSGRDHPRSQTSRELVERLRLDSPQRQALGGLVNAVERTLFGGRPLTATTFEFCRRKVQTLVAGTSL